MGETEHHHEWFDSSIQIGLVSEADFRSNLPKHFKYGIEGRITFDKNHVNVLAGDTLITSPFSYSSFPQEVMIDSREALVDMKRQLLTFPTYMPYHLAKTPSCCGTVDYIAYINPKHPRIRDKLEKSFDRCLDHLTRGEHFSMEIRLDEAMQKYCRRTFRKSHTTVPYNPVYICVTNTGQRCQELYHPWIWICCLPCALLCGVPYCLCRGCTTKDFECQITGDVTHISHLTEHRQNVHRTTQIAHVTVRHLEGSVASREATETTTTSAKLPSYLEAHGNPNFPSADLPKHDPYDGYRGPEMTDYKSDYTTTVRDPYEGYKRRESS